MTIDQKRAAESAQEKRKLVLDRSMIGSVRLIEPLEQLNRGDWPSPEISVLLSARRHDPETAASARRDPSAPGTIDDRRVDVVFGAVAVDRGPWGACDDRSAATFKRPPDQPIDERILEHLKRRHSGRCALHEPLWIVTPGMGHGQEHGQGTTRRMDDWRSKRRHNELSRQS